MTDLSQSVADVSAAEREAAEAAGVSTKNAGLAVLTALRNYGVDTVFGIPGTHNLEFYRHLRRLGIHAVTSRHEQGAGYGADGWAQQRGLPGVVITTSGPGLLNALSAAGTAYCESRPFILLSPGVPEGEEFADIGALHETKDATGAVGSIVEWSRRVTSAEEAVQSVHDAFELFRTGRPRPVHIEIPLNVLESEAAIDESLLAARPHPGHREADADRLAAAARLLAGAERPAIIAGGGSTSVAAELTALAELLGAPVATTLNGKAAVSEHHPLSLRAELRLAAVRDVINASDVLLVVGSKLGEAELWGGVIDPAGKVIRVDVLETQLDKNLRVDVGLQGHAEAVVPALLEALRGTDAAASDPAASSTREAKPTWADIESVRAASEVEARSYAPLAMAAAVDIASAIDPDAIVAGDSSQITYMGMASAMLQQRPHSFLYTAAYATLGYGLPAAIGARVGAPESRDVVCVVGDGALMFAVQEFATAIEQGLNLTVVCVNNGGYAEIKQNELDRGISPIGVDLAQPDWAALAEAFGGTGLRVTDRSRTAETVREAIARPGLTLVHIPLGIYAE
ncbi:thiamine pyrophosphate-binding protein [Ruicaihuangia caeni]|uniref:Thiamine pyrophosphate-binding protein n=1 Tax=Ruicaihuangia caeni TaxID=3042517 RepID=A0AAW6TBG7_9MICO|nr:thiamine pyrophosphate-binding protein [Klugiella sp. YN-L-19]MDI2099183.1 thiamine pyrophosphate-binding protein [Klugiella sp. YN-L-19]